MSSFLRKLTIGHFRGACQPVCLNFKAEKKIALISGNNGTGKSTICDALEMVGCSKIGSIEDKKFGGGGINKKAFLPTIDRKESDVKIELESTTGQWTATLGKKDIYVSPSTDQLDIRVLRRSNILRIVEANGVDRYQVMREFLDLSKIESVEKSLGEALKSFNQKANDTALTLTNNKHQLEELWHDHGSSGKNAIDWSNSIIANKQATTKLIDLKPLLRDPNRLLRSLPELEAECSTKQSDLKILEDEFIKTDADLKQATTQLPNAEQAEALDCLEVALKFLQKDDAFHDCPVCGTTFEKGKLVAAIEDRLTRMKILRAVSAKCKDINSSITRAKNLLSDVVKRKNEIPDLVTKQLDPLQNLGDADAKAIAELIVSYLLEYRSDNKLSPDTVLSKIDGIIAEREKGFLKLETEEKLKKQVERLLAAIVNDEKVGANYLLAAQKAERTVKTIEDERKKYVDEVLLNISSDVNGLFSILHPDEKLGGIRLSVKERGHGSVEITSDFHGKTNVPPEAFFSDSHLDTLGICIFIALAKANGNAQTVLVLDDIVSSIDRDHIARLVQLLADETDNFGHIVVTTHLELLEEWFRHNVKAANQTQFERIAEWSFSDGFRMIAREFQMDLLRNMMAKAPLDKDGVGNKAGNILGVLLNQIALSYRVLMPRVSPIKYTYSDFFQAFNRDVRDHKIIVDIQTPSGIVSASLAHFLDPIENHAWIRNIVAHGDMEKNSMLSDSDVKEFASLVIGLNDEFCNSIPVHKRCLC